MKGSHVQLSIETYLYFIRATIVHLDICALCFSTAACPQPLLVRSLQFLEVWPCAE